jgi:hypothetical protein
MDYGAQATSTPVPVLDTIATTLNFFDERMPETDYRWTGRNESERPMNLSPQIPTKMLFMTLGGFLPVNERRWG